MLILKAVLLGIVEGLTEFIPVSSTGHLILFGRAIGFEGALADSFDIFIQLGAILAALVLYFPRFTGLLDLRNSWRNPDKKFRGWDGIFSLFLACLPAFVAGALLHGFIKEYLFSPVPVAIALIVGGLALIWLENRQPARARQSELTEIRPLQCLGVGVFQCLALWPGMSRSGATIIGGMLLGLQRRTAAEFSFIVAVPVMFAAVSYDLLKSVKLLSPSELPVFAVGFVVSFIVALLAIRFFIALLDRLTLKPFGWYRVALGIAVLLLA